MIVGDRVTMKQPLQRVGILAGAEGEIVCIDRKGRVMVKFDKPFGFQGNPNLGNGYLFDPNGQYKPEDYIAKIEDESEVCETAEATP